MSRSKWGELGNRGPLLWDKYGMQIQHFTFFIISISLHFLINFYFVCYLVFKEIPFTEIHVLPFLQCFFHSWKHSKIQFLWWCLAAAANLDFAPIHISMLVRNFLSKNPTNLIRKAPRARPTLAPCDFFSIYTIKTTTGTSMWIHWGDEAKFAVGIKRHRRNRIFRIFSSVGKMLEKSYCKQWRLLWNWQNRNINKCKNILSDLS